MSRTTREKLAPAGVFGYAAGKSIIAKELVQLFPDHEAYVEPFCGSAALFFTKSAAPLEALNDRNADVIDAFKAIKSITDDELEELSSMDWTGHKKTFDELRDSEPESKLDRLYKFLYVVRFSYAKNMKTFNPDREGFDTIIASRVSKGRERLKDAIITCGDYEKAIAKNDDKGTLHFLDPPYVGSSSGGGIGEKGFDEARFRKVLEKIEGQFILTYGVTGALDTSGFEVQRMKQRRQAHYVKAGEKRNDDVLTHLVVSNFKVAKKSLDGIELDDVVQIIDTDEEGSRIMVTGSKTSESVPADIGARAIVQARFVQKRCEVDLLFEVDGTAKSWTIDTKRAGEPEEIAKSLAFAERLGEGMRARATEVNVDADVVWQIDALKVELGVQRENLREFFISKGEELNGVLRLELPEDQPLGEKHPWIATIYDRWPSAFYDFTVLKSGEPMPPDGTSALPASLEREIPPELRYWEMRGDVAKNVRSALAKSRLLAGENVAIVDDEFVRVVHAIELPTEVPSFDVDAAKLGKAEWSSAYQNDLPDSSFLFVESGGEKDEEGKTKPRSLRHFPVKDKDGSVDAAHAENAIARIPQSNAEGLSADKKTSLQDKARRLYESTQKTAKAAPSMNTIQDAVQTALNEKFPSSRDYCGPCIWVSDLFPDAAVYPKDGCLWRIEYKMNGAVAELTSEPEQVVRSYEYVSKKEKPKLRVYTEPSDDSPDLGKGDLSTADLATDGGALLPSQRKPRKKSISELVSVRLLKASDKDDRIVYGIVLEPDVVDAQQDQYNASEVRDAAHKYMELHQNTGLMHKQEINDKAKVIESFIAPADFSINGQSVKKGSWVMAMRVLDDDLWSAAKKGELGGFSIGGSAKRIPVAS